jgi:hypothetical protein
MLVPMLVLVPRVAEQRVTELRWGYADKEVAAARGIHIVAAVGAAALRRTKMAFRCVLLLRETQSSSL